MISTPISRKTSQVLPELSAYVTGPDTQLRQFYYSHPKTKQW
jgi:hypothetical protein